MLCIDQGSYGTNIRGIHNFQFGTKNKQSDFSSFLGSCDFDTPLLLKGNFGFDVVGRMKKHLNSLELNCNFGAYNLG